MLQTTTHQLGTTHQVQQDVAPTCFHQGFPGSWQFFLEECRTSHRGAIRSLSRTVCLNHTVILNYLINAELYLTFSKYVDKLLLVVNIVKFAYFNVVAYSLFRRICSLINNLKTLNGHGFIFVGKFVDIVID